MTIAYLATLIGAIAALTFSMLIPTLPVIALSETGGKPEQAGWIFGLFTASVLLARMLLDRLSQAFGAGRLLMSASIWLAISVGAYFFVTAMQDLYLVRIAHGFGFGVITTVTASLVVRLTPTERRGRAIGYYGMAQALSMAIGPVLGEALLGVASSALYAFLLLDALIACVISIYVYRHFPLGNPEAPVRPSEEKRSVRWIERKAVPAALQMLFVAVVFGCMLSYLPIYSEWRGHGDWTGTYFLCYAMSLFAVRPISGGLIDTGRTAVALWIGLGAMSGSVALLLAANSVPGFLVSGLLLGCGMGCCQTALQVISLRDVVPTRYAAATGTFFISLDLGFSVGGVLFGMLSRYFSIYSLFQSLFIFLISAGGLAALYHAGEKRKATVNLTD